MPFCSSLHGLQKPSMNFEIRVLFPHQSMFQTLAETLDFSSPFRLSVSLSLSLFPPPLYSFPRSWRIGINDKLAIFPSKIEKSPNYIAISAISNQFWCSGENGAKCEKTAYIAGKIKNRKLKSPILYSAILTGQTVKFFLFSILKMSFLNF